MRRLARFVMEHPFVSSDGLLARESVGSGSVPILRRAEVLLFHLQNGLPKVISMASLFVQVSLD